MHKPIDLDALEEKVADARMARILFEKGEIDVKEKMQRQAAANVAITNAYPALVAELKALRIMLGKDPGTGL
jgi:hypothetical protein